MEFRFPLAPPPPLFNRQIQCILIDWHEEEYVRPVVVLLRKHSLICVRDATNVGDPRYGNPVPDVFDRTHLLEHPVLVSFRRLTPTFSDVPRGEPLRFLIKRHDV